MWEIWEHLPGQIFDNYCICLAGILEKYEKLDLKLQLGGCLRFQDTRARCRRSPNSNNFTMGKTLNNPLHLFLALISKANGQLVKSIVQAFVSNLPQNKSLSNEVLFLNVFLNILIEIKREIIELDATSIIKIQIKKNMSKSIEIKTIILEIFAVILKPQRENPDWVDNSFLSSMGSYLIDEVWGLAQQKIQTQSSYNNQDDKSNSESNTNNYNLSKGDQIETFQTHSLNNYRTGLSQLINSTTLFF